MWIILGCKDHTWSFIILHGTQNWHGEIIFFQAHNLKQVNIKDRSVQILQCLHVCTYDKISAGKVCIRYIGMESTSLCLSCFLDHLLFKDPWGHVLQYPHDLRPWHTVASKVTHNLLLGLSLTFHPETRAVKPVVAGLQGEHQFCSFCLCWVMIFSYNSTFFSRCAICTKRLIQGERGRPREKEERESRWGRETVVWKLETTDKALWPVRHSADSPVDSQSELQLHVQETSWEGEASTLTNNCFHSARISASLAFAFTSKLMSLMNLSGVTKMFCLFRSLCKTPQSCTFCTADFSTRNKLASIR